MVPGQHLLEDVLVSAFSVEIRSMPSAHEIVGKEPCRNDSNVVLVEVGFNHTLGRRPRVDRIDPRLAHT